MSRNGGSTDNEGATPQFPRCFGYEVFLYGVVPTAGTASAPANVHSREDHNIPHPQTHKPTHAVGDDFLNRFTRNANLVASRIARDMRRVGNNIKNNVEDILFPSRKPPK